MATELIHKKIIRWVSKWA